MSQARNLHHAASERKADASAAEHRACDGSNSLADLAARIRAKHEAVGQALRRGLEDMIAAGDMLNEAKRQIKLNKHARWLPWLKEHCQIPERTAQTLYAAGRAPSRNPQRCGFFRARRH